MSKTIEVKIVADSEEELRAALQEARDEFELDDAPAPVPSDEPAAADAVTSDLIRAIRPGLEIVREEPVGDDSTAAGPATLGTMVGRFAVFNEWTEIDSIFEGRFLERIAPGAFARTFAEDRADMRVLFQHGFDPQAGDKPMGPIEVLEETKAGAQYEVPLLDTSYNRDIVPGLEQGLYGASFRFRVIREEFNQEPRKTRHNPEGIPERTLQEVRVREFGPVTFPAYAGATAGMRSLTDMLVVERLVREHPHELRALLEGRQISVLRADDPAVTADAGGTLDVTVDAQWAAMVAQHDQYRARERDSRRRRGT